mgnify:FL=1|tara:strand:- start:4773 stop:5123 length:351 start_codon:yes stop_codon:yes gene_type:complete
MKGYSSHLVPGQNKYDMVIEEDNQLIKVQIKTSTYSPKIISTQYQLQRRIPKLGKYIVKPYEDTDFDIFCFVQPNLKLCAWFYKPDITNKCKLSIQHQEYEIYTLEKALERYNEQT